MSTTNGQSKLSPEAEAYIAQTREAFGKSPDGYELQADASVEEINTYYRNVAAYAKTQAIDTCEKKGYVDTRTGAYADMQAADDDRESFNKRDKAFQFGNKYKDLGDKDKLQAEYDSAVANGQTELADALSSSLDAINSADKEISNRKAAAQTKYDNAGYGIDARDTETAFWDAWLEGDTDATNNAFNAYKEADNKNFEVNIMPEMASGIRSQADAEAYNKACSEHGIERYQNTKSDTVPKEEQAEDTQEFEAQVKESNVAASAPEAKTEEVSETSKPDPYAGFEKPECPPGMPGSAYTQMCAESEKAYRNSVNEKRAAEIMASGDYKNNNDYLNKLAEDGYDVAAVQGIMDEKSKAREQTAEVAESPAASAEKNEKPNPYAFEKPEREPGMTDEAYDNMCKLKEAEHIDKVNHDFAAEINAGKYGNGEERKAALKAAGADYNAVQSIINNEYVPAYEAERAKQAEQAKQAAPETPAASEIPKTDLDAALAEAENDTKKIELKDINNVKLEGDSLQSYTGKKSEGVDLHDYVDKEAEGGVSGKNLAEPAFEGDSLQDYVGREPEGGMSVNGRLDVPARESDEVEAGVSVDKRLDAPDKPKPKSKPARTIQNNAAQADADAFKAGGANDNRGKNKAEPAPEAAGSGQQNNYDPAALNWSSEQKSELSMLNSNPAEIHWSNEQKKDLSMLNNNPAEIRVTEAEVKENPGLANAGKIVKKDFSAGAHVADNVKSENDKSAAYEAD